MHYINKGALSPSLKFKQKKRVLNTKIDTQTFLEERMPTSYKLIYFALKGRAEVSRLILAYGGQEYEDLHNSFEAWPSYKQNMPFRQAPVLEITQDGKTTLLAQSGAIERYLANKFGLFGDNDLERARIDMINEQVLDIHKHLFSFYLPIYQKAADIEDKKAGLAKALDETVPNMLKHVEALFEANQKETSNSGFLVGDRLSVADIKLVNIYDWFGDKREEILDKVPLLKEHINTVRNHPKLKSRFEAGDKLKVTILF
jgi:glutathione S-transferase